MIGHDRNDRQPGLGTGGATGYLRRQLGPAVAATRRAPGRYRSPVAVAVSLAVLVVLGVPVVDPLEGTSAEAAALVGRPPAGSAAGWAVAEPVAVPGRRSLVLGPPSALPTLRQLAASADRAVSRVDAVWGGSWSGRAVIVVPRSSRELARLVPGVGPLSEIAAVTTERSRTVLGADPPGDRIIVNPPEFARLSPLGRDVVLTHEVTHVVTRSAGASGSPSWLSEGFADYVGYRGTGVPVTAAARELLTELSAGRPLVGLPTDADLAGSGPRLPATYQASWLGCQLVAQRYGEASLVRLYRTVGAAGGERTTVWRKALREVLGTTPQRFVADSRRYVRVSLLGSA